MRRNPFVFLLTIAAFLTLQQTEIKAATLKSSPPAFTPPASPRAVYNFNPDWKFTFGDQAGAEQPGFNDAAWSSVSLPHTWNETDSYRAYISHGGGDQSEKMMGIGWYRKHFKLPASADGQKVFLAFEGMRQAGRFYLNGKEIGLHEDGVTAAGCRVRIPYPRTHNTFRDCARFHRGSVVWLGVKRGLKRVLESNCQA